MMFETNVDKSVVSYVSEALLYILLSGGPIRYPNGGTAGCTGRTGEERLPFRRLIWPRNRMTINDSGKGIGEEAGQRTGEQKGLFASADRSMTPRKSGVILYPGFSTNERPEYSGRGVGRMWLKRTLWKALEITHPQATDQTGGSAFSISVP